MTHSALRGCDLVAYISTTLHYDILAISAFLTR